MRASERVCALVSVRALVRACVRACVRCPSRRVVCVRTRARARASLGKLSNMQRGGLITGRFEAVAVYQSTWNSYHRRFRLSPREEQGA